MFEYITELLCVLRHHIETSASPKEEAREHVEELELYWSQYQRDLSELYQALERSVQGLSKQVRLGSESGGRSGSNREIYHERHVSTRDQLRDIQGLMQRLETRLSVIGSDIESALEFTEEPIPEPDMLLNIDSIDFHVELSRNDVRSPEYDEETSFLAKLHENNVWDFKAYWRFELALFALAKYETSITAPKLFNSVFHVYTQTLGMLSCCVDERDLYTIKNIDHERLQELRERLVYIVSVIFDGGLPKNHSVGIPNPYL